MIMVIVDDWWLLMIPGWVDTCDRKWTSIAVSVNWPTCTSLGWKVWCHPTSYLFFSCEFWKPKILWFVGFTLHEYGDFGGMFTARMNICWGIHLHLSLDFSRFSLVYLLTRSFCHDLNGETGWRHLPVAFAWPWHWGVKLCSWHLWCWRPILQSVQVAQGGILGHFQIWHCAILDKKPSWNWYYLQAPKTSQKPVRKGLICPNAVANTRILKHNCISCQMLHTVHLGFVCPTEALLARHCHSTWSGASMHPRLRRNPEGWLHQQPVCAGCWSFARQFDCP